MKQMKGFVKIVKSFDNYWNCGNLECYLKAVTFMYL